jgi:hypothetical protein
MFKKTLLAVALFGAALGASASENPLDPGFERYNAALSFATPTGGVNVAPTPLSPTYFQWNVAGSGAQNTVEVVNNNPLQPGYKRS